MRGPGPAPGSSDRRGPPGTVATAPHALDLAAHDVVGPRRQAPPVPPLRPRRHRPPGVDEPLPPRPQRQRSVPAVGDPGPHLGADRLRAGRVGHRPVVPRRRDRCAAGLSESRGEPVAVAGQGCEGPLRGGGGDAGRAGVQRLSRSAQVLRLPTVQRVQHLASRHRPSDERRRTHPDRRDVVGLRLGHPGRHGGVAASGTAPPRLHGRRRDARLPRPRPRLGRHPHAGRSRDPVPRGDGDLLREHPWTSPGRAQKRRARRRHDGRDGPDRDPAGGGHPSRTVRAGGRHQRAGGAPHGARTRGGRPPVAVHRRCPRRRLLRRPLLAPVRVVGAAAVR